MTSLPPKPPATPTGVGILFNPIPMNHGKPSDAQEASLQPIAGPIEVPGPKLSNKATGVVTQPPISMAGPLAREDNEVQKELITRVAEQAAVSKVSELCPRLVTRHINELEQNASAVSVAHIETKFEAWKNQVVGEVQRFMNVEIPRHLKEISDEVDLLRSSSLLAGTKVDDLQKSIQLMQRRLTMLTNTGWSPPLLKMLHRVPNLNWNVANPRALFIEIESIVIWTIQILLLVKKSLLEAGALPILKLRSEEPLNETLVIRLEKKQSRARDVRSLEWTSWYLTILSSRKSCRTRRTAWMTKTRVKMRTFANVWASLSVFSM